MRPQGNNPMRLALPLVTFALITLTVGLMAGRTTREPYAVPFFHLFFKDVLQMKAWLITTAVGLACGQLLTAARIYELLRFPPPGPWMLPVAGGLLLALLLGLWLTSALVYFAAGIPAI